MFEWILALIITFLVLFTGGTTPDAGEQLMPRKTRSRIAIPTVLKEDSPLWAGTPGLKSALKSPGTSGGKKSIKWADKAEFRAITSKGKIIDKTVAI